ncbi:NTP transferase domain-containing protein [Streptomyces triticiradicis]|uniref:Molybdenum cofactor guanylyltransferase n=1 Tax=Streptomyces triticiradicis TaxID=2651189 RepID=A0A7J5DFB8_9ACTN|nr:molybdenum cofactor guanylyltransferase [Streptomyces triticiradicis]
MTAYEPEGATGRPGSRDPRGASGAGAGSADAGYDAVVLAGGAARRLGGEDKPGVRVGGRRLLDRVLAACADATRTVVVADPRSTARPVEWAREDPPGGGPLAALDAGLRHTAAPYVLVLSADLPFLEEKTVRRLLDTLRSGGGTHGAPPAPEALRQAPAGQAPGPGGQGARSEAQAIDDGERAAGFESHATGPGGHHVGPAGQGMGLGGYGTGPDGQAPGPGGQAPGPGGQAPGPDGVLLVDSGGRDQPLVAVYRADALRRELDVLAAAHGSLAGLPLRRLVAALDLTRITDPVASFDCDTWDDIAAARTRIREHEHVLDEWISAVKDELGIDLDVDTGVLLDLARDAAHGVARPAAPLTTFLVGYAAARAGGGPEAVAEAARKAAALALRWAEEDTPDARPDATSPATEPDAG